MQVIARYENLLIRARSNIPSKGNVGLGSNYVKFLVIDDITFDKIRKSFQINYLTTFTLKLKSKKWK